MSAQKQRKHYYERKKFTHPEIKKLKKVENQ